MINAVRQGLLKFVTKEIEIISVSEAKAAKLEPSITPKELIKRINMLFFVSRFNFTHIT
jgi:hypothetical protein